MANVLIIDDDAMICDTLGRHVERLGHRVTAVPTLREGLEEVRKRAFDVVFLDVNLPDGNGLRAIPHFRKAGTMPEVIIITGAGEPDGAELAIKGGAWDYLQKPFLKRDVILQLVRVLQYREEKTRPKSTVSLKREGIIGHSPGINACLDLVAQAAQSRANVLITGETGTGKELIAQAIHENSPVAGNNFVVVDCTVLPEKLVESLLFGHRKGAFTGADRSTGGVIRQAHQGTLFLDEIGELPQDLQKAFLRVIQEHRFRPVGGSEEVESNFRLVAATNRDLDQMCDVGLFRKDLLYRLRSITIELPPLRDRLQDIRELAMYHVARLCESNKLKPKGFSPEFFEMLASYDWPGNVRELVNALDQAVNAEPTDPILFPKHLPDRIRIQVARASIPDGRMVETTPEPPQSLPTMKEWRETSIAASEHKYLNNLMMMTKGDIQEACRISGLKRARLYELMKKYKVSRHR